MLDFTPIASGSRGNAYHLTDGKTPLLLEAGVPVRRIQEAIGFHLYDVRGCLITHCHRDHSKAAHELLRYGVDVYTGKGTIDACGLRGHRVHVTKPLQQLNVGTWDILPFDVEHDAPDSQGFLLASRATGEKLLYFTDTYYIKYRFSGLDHIACECNYTREALQKGVAAGTLPAARVHRLVKSHMSLETLKDMLRANDLTKLRRVWLLHLSEENSEEERMKKEIEELTGAEVRVC